MAKLTVQSGKGKIRLKKSKELVGLKTKNQSELQEKPFIQEKHLERLGGFNIVRLNKSGRSLDKRLDQIRADDDIDVGTHVYVADGSDKPLVPTGEIVIVFHNLVSAEEQALVLDEFQLDLVERRDSERIIAKVTERSPNPLKVAAALERISMVKFAEPDLDTLLDEYDFRAPNDGLFNHQWYFQNNGQVVDANHRLKRGADAKILNAWKRLGNAGSSRVTMAIIDNGFDTNHPDLRAKVVRPFDLWTNSSRLVQGDTRFTHGTPCASIALASQNGTGIVGVAPNARFMPVSGTSFSLRATEQMFDYCIRNGADIISCSWGTTDPNFHLNAMKEEAIAKAARLGRNGKGCIILFAAGNEGKDHLSYYAAHPDVIAVGACTSQDQHAPYSNRGRQLSVCAPSNGDWPVIAAKAWWDQGENHRNGGNFRFWADGRNRGQHYKHFGGTSASTPLVAGICALMLSANPDLRAREVKEILQQTADKIGNPWEYSQGHSTKYGYGRVNADRAVAEAIRRRESSRPFVQPNPTPSPTPTPSPSPTPTPVTNTGNSGVQTGVSSGKGLFRFSVRRQGASGFGVQIGAFGSYGNVLVQAEKIERLFGVPVVVQITESGGRTVYKIVAGSFAAKSEADNLFSRMRSQGYNGFVRNLRDFQ
ncbi:MAG: S8 family serine peptidase [Bacteroidota bacterium]